MRPPVRLECLLTAAVLGMSCACGIEAASAAEEARRAFGFSGPEIFKLDWGIAQLQTADINGDGLADIAVVNNKRAKVEFLIQRTEAQRRDAAGKVRVESNLNVLPDDTRFEKRPYLVAKHINSLRLGDLNSDGRTDMAFYGDPKELVVVYGAAEGAWGAKRTFRITDGATDPYSLAIGDVNGDKRNDLVLLGEADTYFIYQDSKGRLKEPVKQPGPGSQVAGMEARDLDGDGRDDLIFLAPRAPEPLIVRLQDASGLMGPELTAKVPQPRLVEIQDCDGDGRAELVLVERLSGRLKVVRLVFASRDKAPVPGRKPQVLDGQMQRYPLTVSVSSRPRAMALGDVNADGKLDILVTDPAGAQVAFYPQGLGGALNRRELFPSLKGASGIAVADLDGDGKAEVLVLSAEERMVGVSRREAGGRLSFPKPLPTLGKPLCFDAADLNGDKRIDIVYAFSEKSKRSLQVLLGGPGGEFTPQKPAPIPLCRADPTGLRLADADQDGKLDVLLFVPYDCLRVFTRDAKGDFIDRSRSESYRKGLVSKATTSAFSVGDVTGDGKPEMLLAEKNFARALVLNAAGSVEVADQFNGRSSSSRIAGAAAADFDGDGRPEIVLFDRTDQALSVLRRLPTGKFEIAQTLHIGPFQFAGMFARDVNGDGTPDIVLFGKQEFGVIYARGSRLHVQEVAAFETKIEKGRYQYVAVGDLNADKTTDLLLVEGNKHFLEILTFSRPDTLVHGTQFKVFETKRFAGRRFSGAQASEPREAVVADVTGDGKADIVLVVHDRVIVYPQE